jgi:OST-HTH/LOTUS domain
VGRIGAMVGWRPPYGLLELGFFGLDHVEASGSRVGFRMTASLDEAVDALQRDVQRLLGRCMLRLQQYEWLLKTIVAHGEISGPVRDLEAIRVARVESAARKTLGTLIGEFLGSSLVSGEAQDRPEAEGEGPGDLPFVSIRIGLRFHLEDFADAEADLKDLVLLRNMLVHHFIELHDPWTAEGCRRAQEALAADYHRIDQSYERLREWAKDMEQSRQQLQDVARSAAFRDLVVDGIAPDGSVVWPSSGIVRALEEAAELLAIDGWAGVSDAGRWIAEKYPHQTPARYGCKSWRQVVHQSRMFDLQRRGTGNQRAARYRLRKGAKDGA